MLDSRSRAWRGAWIVATSLCVTCAACAGCAGQWRVIDPVTGVSCELDDTAMVRDTLYFGRGEPSGDGVADGEWKRFLDEVVTPRFPDGLTVFDATGQWRGKSGVLVQERSVVVTILHAPDEASTQAVHDIAAEYKRRFAQEAVLRERTPTCARFE